MNRAITTNYPTKKVAFLLADLSGGGIQKIIINLLKEIEKTKRFNLELVVLNLLDSTTERAFLENIPSEIKIINLSTKVEYRIKSYIKILFSLLAYLNTEKPNIIISNIPLINFLSILAQKLTFRPVCVFVVEHTFFLKDTLNLIETKHGRFYQKNTSSVISVVMRWLYPHTNGIITVSRGLASYLKTTLHLKTNSVKVIYNPVVNREILSRAEEPVEIDFIKRREVPVFLAVGRLSIQKDYETMLEAFVVFKQNKSGKLLILGEGELRERLESLIEKLGLNEDVTLLGFTANPYAYMSKVNSLILSSLWEGLPTVVIEAMACGCQVIATDCPYGPREILAGGEYGFLVPTRDAIALARAMHEVLVSPKNPEILKQRARDFTIEKATAEYLSLIDPD
jgi:glycosyltransferase involved in cell wall biosynthesis